MLNNSMAAIKLCANATPNGICQCTKISPKLIWQSRTSNTLTTQFLIFLEYAWLYIFHIISARTMQVTSAQMRCNK